MTERFTAIYYAIGVAWLTTGLLPGKWGWLTHKMPPFYATAFVVFGGAIWPLFLGKILWRMVVHGDKEIDL